VTLRLFTEYYFLIIGLNKLEIGKPIKMKAENRINAGIHTRCNKGKDGT
jgi:hypothetical protein